MREIRQFLDKLDTGLYRVFHHLGLLVKGLTKSQQRILQVLSILVLIFWVKIINDHVENNAVWLYGEWTARSIGYSIRTDNYRLWTVRENSDTLLKDAMVSVGSTKRNVILMNENGETEYHFTRLDKRHLNLKIFTNYREMKSVKLEKKN